MPSRLFTDTLPSRSPNPSPGGRAVSTSEAHETPTHLGGGKCRGWGCVDASPAVWRALTCRGGPVNASPARVALLLALGRGRGCANDRPSLPGPPAMPVPGLPERDARELWQKDDWGLSVQGDRPLRLSRRRLARPWLGGGVSLPAALFNAAPPCLAGRAALTLPTGGPEAGACSRPRVYLGLVMPIAKGRGTVGRRGRGSRVAELFLTCSLEQTGARATVNPGVPSWKDPWLFPAEAGETIRVWCRVRSESTEHGARRTEHRRGLAQPRVLSPTPRLPAVPGTTGVDPASLCRQARRPPVVKGERKKTRRGKGGEGGSCIRDWAGLGQPRDRG